MSTNVSSNASKHSVGYVQKIYHSASVIVFSLIITLVGGWSCNNNSSEKLDTRDCKTIFQYSQGLSQELCQVCQDALCPWSAGTIPEECSFFPCVAGKTEVRLCETDEDCADIDEFCPTISRLGTTCQIPIAIGGYDNATDCRAAGFCANNDCRDCRIVFLNSQVSLDSCRQCQDATCIQQNDPCYQYPCVEGKHVIQACGCDSDCEGIAPFCGWRASIHAICQESDPL
jgi:hypothetical protein